jgi:hypothetical protein
VLDVNQAFLDSFVASKKIKVTELGHEKVSIDLVNPGQVLDSLRSCFTSQGSATPLPSPHALEGGWYSTNQSACKEGPSDSDGGGLVTFRGGHLIGYESDCKIVGSKANGQFLALRMTCSGEGMRERRSELFEFLGENKIRSFQNGSKTNSITLNRCPISR